MYFKAKHTINLKPNPTLLGTGDLILQLNILKPWALVCALEKSLLLSEYSTYRVINRTQCCEFSARPYYLVQTMLPHKNNVAETDDLFTTYYVFTRFCLTIRFLQK